ncbi:MAG: hypothetical protein ABGY95_04915 [Rubritalea sp.]|uniref:hypothetical protein n=1 Tax=Rubritalea sp. TaxID=2109375 RepID=UPI0032425DA6
MTAKPIHTNQINSLMGSVSPLVIIVVRLAGDYDSKPIPIAINNTVFEVSFSNKMADFFYSSSFRAAAAVVRKVAMTYQRRPKSHSNGL